MSSNDDIASEDWTFLVSNYCANAGSSLVVYEYMITLGREVELFWKGRLTGAAILFYFNRYLSLVVDVYGLLENMHVSDKEGGELIVFMVWVCSCPDVARSSKALDILQYFPWAVFSALRAFALTKNWPLAILIFLLSMVPLGVNFAHFAFNSTGENFFTGCLTTDDVSSELAKQCLVAEVTIASRTCLITADVLLIYVTWFNMYRRAGPRHPTVKNRFLNILLRDGTIYFVVLAILNTLHLTLSLLSIEYSISNISFVTQFSEPLTTILVSRFLLHLQAANRQVLHLSSLDDTLAASSQTDTLVFERVIGSLAEELDVTTYEYMSKAPIEIELDLPKLDSRERPQVGEGVGEEGEGMEMTPVSPSSGLERSAA